MRPHQKKLTKWRLTLRERIWLFCYRFPGGQCFSFNILTRLFVQFESYSWEKLLSRKMVPLASFWSIGFKGSHCYRDLRHIFHCLKVAPSNKDAIYYEHRIPSTTIYGGLIGLRFASAASPSATRVSTLFVSSYSFYSVDGESEIDRSSESVGVLWHYATQSQDGRKSSSPLKWMIGFDRTHLKGVVL